MIYNKDYNMERLKGKEILIGKEPHGHRLLIAVKNGGQIKSVAIGAEGGVPNCVSRCKPAEAIAHCKLVIGQDGVMSIHNLKMENVTYVNDMEIGVREVSDKSNVALGKDKYPMDINKILTAAHNLIEKEPFGHSIKHLQRVWEKYDKDLYELQKRQKNLGLIKSLYMPCTVISGMAGLAFKHLGVDGSISDTVSLVMYFIAAAVLFYGLYKTVTDRSIEEKKQLNEKFQEDYVCPHCKRFLGFQPYNILSQNKNCPYNKCKWDT